MTAAKRRMLDIFQHPHPFANKTKKRSSAIWSVCDSLLLFGGGRGGQTTGKMDVRRGEREFSCAAASEAVFWFR